MCLIVVFVSYVVIILIMLTMGSIKKSYFWCIQVLQGKDNIVYF